MDKLEKLVGEEIYYKGKLSMVYYCDTYSNELLIYNEEDGLVWIKPIEYKGKMFCSRENIARERRAAKLLNLYRFDS